MKWGFDSESSVGPSYGCVGLAAERTCPSSMSAGAGVIIMINSRGAEEGQSFRFLRRLIYLSIQGV